MQVLFPDHYYYQYKAPNADDFIDRLNREHNVDNSQFPWGKDCEVDLIRLGWEEYFKYLTPSMDLLRKDMSGIYEFSICDPWLNLYKKGGFQECHDHKDADLACVFFLQEDYNFYFVNRNVNLSRVFNQPDRQMISAERGDILFFPAHMLHGVTPNRSDDIRKTFSCNFWMKTL
tara:strand:- start:6492 stop:7013 length:522 start_codon:yes stop_codon:yes gene_type:complete